MTLVYVAIGGALGALARYGIGRAILARSGSAFPLGTFAANTLGPLLLGLLMGLQAGGSIYALLGDGFLGAFTTFSTLMYEEITLIADNEKKNAAVYITGTLLLGTAVYFAGYFAGIAIG